MPGEKISRREFVGRSVLAASAFAAGAKLTDILMNVPAARPLFKQMISESGGAERVWPQAVAGGVGHGFVEAWQKNTSKPASALLTAAAEELIPVQKMFLEDWPQHFPFIRRSMAS